ncbi:hypothetical protein TNCV_3411721 [Trichonephila clavipes]|nr:hypothetical protein TNCV_3411721 [Trichonephila clavipes]
MSEITPPQVEAGGRERPNVDETRVRHEGENGGTQEGGLINPSIPNQDWQLHLGSIFWRDPINFKLSNVKTLREYPCLFSQSSQWDDTTGKQPLSEFCSVAFCSSGLGGFVFLGYLPGPEGQNLSPIKCNLMRRRKTGRLLQMS